MLAFIYTPMDGWVQLTVVGTLKVFYLALSVLLPSICRQVTSSRCDHRSTKASPGGSLLRYLGSCGCYICDCGRGDSSRLLNIVHKEVSQPVFPILDFVGSKTWVTESSGGHIQGQYSTLHHTHLIGPPEYPT